MIVTTSPQAKPVTVQHDVKSKRPQKALLIGILIGVIALVAGIALPYVVTSYYTMSLAVQAALLGMMAVGIGFLVRYLGMISLGHTAFYGCAAYGVGIAAKHFGWGPLPAVLFAVAVGTLISLIMGILVVRSSGMGFLMLTLALSQVLYELCVQTSFRPLTGAYDGLLISFGANETFLGQTPADMQNPGLFWPIVWVALVVSIVALWLLGRSRFGTVLEGIRENEERMRFSGYNTFRPRLIAFVCSGMVASIGGALFALNGAYVSPDILGFTQAGNALIATLVGGVGIIIGPLVGTALYVWGQAQFNSGGNLYLYTGLSLIVVLVFLPGGVTGSARRLWKKVRG